MIFVLIAGSFTPFAALVMTGMLATVALWAVWFGAIAGAAFSVAWPTAPNWVRSGLYVALGWTTLISGPQIVDHAGVGAAVLSVFGGVP